MSGVTINTLCPLLILSRIHGFNFVVSLVEIIFVFIGNLPFGNSSIILTSNSQKKAIAIDLGIGVALICKI
ncbi:hypothetical protein IJ913_02105 [bacterium]|jgi:hypothetical protein|nr:hypothetical protein [bacterium]